MKKSQLKELIKQIIKEVLTEQPVGGVKNDHPFDAGRHNVMKVVNVGEMVGDDGRYQDDMESGAAVKKLHNLNEEPKLKGRFVNRGEVKLDGGLDYKTAEKIANSHWDIFGSLGKNERGVYNFKTRGDRFCCSVGMLNGQPAMLSITTTPGRLQLLVGNELNPEMNEMTATGAVAGYATPYAFSKKKSGSQRALDVTKKMGFTKVKDISEDTR